MRAILIADGDVARRSRDVRTLAGAGHLVHEAKDWLDLVGHLLEERIDVLVLDQLLPGIPERELVTFLRHRPQARPWVLLRSRVAPEARRAMAESYRVSSVLDAEAGSEELLEWVGELMTSRVPRRVETRTEPPSSRPAARPEGAAGRKEA